MKFILFFATAAVLIFAACEKTATPAQPYDTGVFIIHEGIFGSGTGTVSHYDRSQSGITNDIFALENNGASLGNILQSMTISHEKAYFIVNNANKIVTTDAGTLKFIDSLTDVQYPRYMLEIDHLTAYISQWGIGGLEGAIRVLNTTTNTFTKTIPTGKGADRMLLAGNTVWVINSGGFDKDSTVALINTATESVTAHITVGTAPNSLVQDANGDVWVLCAGDWGAPSGKLVRITNNTITATFAVPQGASSIVTNTAKNKLYFIGANAIYEKDLTTTAPALWLQQPAASATFGNLYGLGFDAHNNHIYLADAKDFASAGTIYVFDTAKTLQDSIKTGIAPINFVFR